MTTEICERPECNAAYCDGLECKATELAEWASQANIPYDDLCDTVIELKSAEAADINNAGAVGIFHYILEKTGGDMEAAKREVPARG